MQSLYFLFQWCDIQDEEETKESHHNCGFILSKQNQTFECFQ